MTSWQKVSEMAGFAFENGLRLHLDAIASYKRQSFATALQLSILSTEELGKALMLEEYVFRVAVEQTWPDDFREKFLREALSTHTTKHRWFGKSVNDFLQRHLIKNASSIVTAIFKGSSELQKQNSTFVGLTRNKNGKQNLKGRIVVPRIYARPANARRHITLVNDYLLVYAEGYSRNVYATDTPDVGNYLNQSVVKILEEEWPEKSNNASHIIASLRKSSIKKNIHSWFE
jgi:AbiV family abortive infection protein